MSQYHFSEKLSKYIRYIELETGRSIQFQVDKSLSISQAPFGFRTHPSFILVVFAGGINLEEPKHEHSIAHEATHGYLLYKLGYSQFVLKENVNEKIKRHIGLLFTMIDDIAANKILQINGFPPFSPKYLDTIRSEIKVARKLKPNFYSRYTDDNLFTERTMVHRYIMAWGFIKYFELDTYSLRIIKKFLKIFQISYPSQFLMAK